MRILIIIAVVLVIALILALVLAPKRQITAAIEIAAPPEVVWDILTAPGALARLNPAFQSVQGDDWRVGARPQIVMQAGDKTINMRPEVLRVDPARALVWRGRLFIPRLFDGTHSVLLEPTQAGTRFTNAEAFHGILLWFIDVKGFSPDFDAMNAALKDAAERRQRGAG